MTLSPLESLYESIPDRSLVLPLPSELKTLYGDLRFPRHPKGPYIISNFVSTLDGVVSLNMPGHSAGGDISGFNAHDKFVMGLLRASADAVIVGAGTLHSVPDHLWTADYIYPDFSSLYRDVQKGRGQSQPPLNVIVTASGKIDLRLRIFQSGEVPVLIVTTAKGAQQIAAHRLPSTVQVAAIKNEGLLSAPAILDAVVQTRPTDRVLLEGGPQLIGNFFAEKCVNELFLTVAPQIAGRDPSVSRPGLVAGKMFAPEQPLWCNLISIKRAENHLFLRYAF